MTLETTDRLVIYQGNGAATDFGFNFIIPSGTLQVSLQDVATGVITEVLASGSYDVIGLDEPDGGTVTYPVAGSPLDDTLNIVIERIVEYKQELNIPTYGGFNPVTLMRQLDHIVMQTQQLAEGLGRALMVEVGQDPLTPEELQEFLALAENLGTASTKDVEYFATAAQGAKADTAVQPDAALVAALENIIALLPTDLPATPGKLWNNGGLFAIS
jgi:hypothetical protein